MIICIICWVELWTWLFTQVWYLGRVVWSFNAMHQVVTKIWTLNLVAIKIINQKFLSKQEGHDGSGLLICCCFFHFSHISPIPGIHSFRTINMAWRNLIVDHLRNISTKLFENRPDTFWGEDFLSVHYSHITTRCVFFVKKAVLSLKPIFCWSVPIIMKFRMNFFTIPYTILPWHASQKYWIHC